MWTVSVLVFFPMAAWGIFNGSKIAKILAHILLVPILVGGMGLGARMGLLQGSWPQWFQIKIVIWLVAGLLTIFIAGRFKKVAPVVFPIVLVMASMAVWLAVFKPSF